VELEKFHVFGRDAAPQGNGDAVAGKGIGIGGDLPDAPVSAGGEDDGFGVEDVQFAGCQLHCHHAGGHAVYPRMRVDHQQVNNLEFVKEGDVILDALLVECLQDHVTSAVGGVTGAPHWFAGDVVGVSAKRTLGNFAVRCTVEGQAHVFQFIDGRDGLVAHELDGILVAEVIGAFDRIVGVPFRVVFFQVAQGCANAALGGAGVRAGGVEFADYGGLGGLGGVQAGHQACAACAYHDHFKLMSFHYATPTQ